jgi:MFS family permease
MCGYFLSYSTTELYLMRAIHGIGFAFFNVAYYTMLVKAAPFSRTGEVIGYANAMNFVTMIFFPFIGSNLVAEMTRASFNLMFLLAIVGSAVVIISGVFLWYSFHRDQNQFEYTGSSSHIVERKAVGPTLAIMFVSFDIGVVISYSPSLAPLHGISNPGLYLAFLAISQLVSAVIGGPLSDRHGYKPISFLGVVLSSVGLWIGAIGLDIFTYSFSALFLGAGVSFASIGFFSLAAVSVEENRKATAMATVTAGWDAGVMIGSLLIGILIRIRLPLDFLLMLSGAITLICVLFYRRF